MDDGEFVYVIARDGGYEGWSAPIQASRNESEARSLVALMSQTDSFRIFKVPVFPKTERAPWYSIVPLPATVAEASHD